MTYAGAVDAPVNGNVDGVEGTDGDCAKVAFKTRLQR